MSRIWHVSQGHAHANDRNSGASGKPFKTISAAAAVAQPGDTVLVHPGVYRERVAPANGGTAGKPITYQAAVRRRAIICGSDPFNGRWTAVKNSPGVFRADIRKAIDKKFNPFATALQHRPGQTLGQVIVDGEPMHERTTSDEVLRLPGSWQALDGGTALMVHLPVGIDKPAQALIELTVRQRVFAPITRGLAYITVRGFVLQHAANNYCSGFWVDGGQPQMGLIGCRSGHHWIIEDNHIRYAKTFALDIGYEGPTDADGLAQKPGRSPGYHLIRDNHIAANGAGGICGCICPATQIFNNIIEYNETLGTGADESGGIKIHFCYDSRIEGNLVRGNDCPGIWVDNNWRGVRITRNCIIDNAAAGIFCELGDGPMLIDNNVIAYTRATMAMAGDGLYAHDACGVTVAHNMMWFNGNFGLWAHVGSDRNVNYFSSDKHTPNLELGDKLPGASEGWSGYMAQHYPDISWQDRPGECSRWTIVNNMLIGNPRGALSLPPEHPRSTGIISDANVCCSGYDLLISETWGSSLDQPLFVCNTNKERVELADLSKQLVDALPAANRPDPAQWRRLPVLTLTQWQALTGHDRRSRVPVLLRPLLGNHELVMRFIIDDAARAVACAKVPGVDRDWNGKRYGNKPLAGPFQELAVCRELSDGKNYHTPHRGPFEKLSRPGKVNAIPLWPITP